MPVPNDTLIPDGYKRCSKGDECVHPEGPILPATLEYFNADKQRGLFHWCRMCRSRYNKEHELAHPRDPEARRDYGRAYRKTHRNQKNEYNRQAYEANPIPFKTRTDRYRRNHPDRILDQDRQYRLANPDVGKKSGQKYQQSHAEQVRIKSLRRKARKRSLPADFTKSDLVYALEYFHGGCAYCGNPPSMFDRYAVLHADHFIPLSDPDCPGTVKSNMVPACQHCNMDKGNKEPRKWVIERFGKRKGKKILNRIAAYFAEVMEKNR